MSEENKLKFGDINLKYLVELLLLENNDLNNMTICNSSGDILEIGFKEYKEFFPENVNESESYNKIKNEIKEQAGSLCDDYDYYQEQWDAKMNKLNKITILYKNLDKKVEYFYVNVLKNVRIFIND